VRSEINLISEGRGFSSCCFIISNFSHLPLISLWARDYYSYFLQWWRRKRKRGANVNTMMSLKDRNETRSQILRGRGQQCTTKGMTIPEEVSWYFYTRITAGDIYCVFQQGHSFHRVVFRDSEKTARVLYMASAALPGCQGLCTVPWTWRCDRSSLL